MPQDTHDTTPLLSRYMISNPEELTANLLQAFERASSALAEMADRKEGTSGAYSHAAEFATATETVSALLAAWLADPVKLSEAQAHFFGQFAMLWNNVLMRSMGVPVPAIIEPAPGDNRFKDEEWSTNPFFDLFKQGYLIVCKWAEDQLAAMEGLDERQRHRAQFYLRQVTSAFAPSNFPFTNPEVVRETLASNGRNLLAGVNLLAADLKGSNDIIKISQTDVTAFELGRNLATTPGKVVFQNELFQLIQYAPTTEKVRERPLLMVPPWINKYYILDLTGPKSLIKYLVSQGFTVFIMSWVNPDESLSTKTFEDYILEGILEAARAVSRETGVEQTNVLGYCVGGTALSTGLAYLAQRGEEPFKCATLLTTQVDFSLAGDLLLFTDDMQLESLESLMNTRGFLDGSRMANVFNMMRPRDLIWPYIVNNYMLGKKPFPFDLLYWNQDSTRMACANHRFYLREFYNENALARGRMSIGGLRLDLKKIKLPVFSVATREDHIAPAASVFRGIQMFGGPTEFVLAGSGHIAGVINPPDKIKYQYWTKGRSMTSLADWQASASETPGSWWPYWIDWLSQQSGGWVPARSPGARLSVIEEAPGSYVRAP